MEQDNANNYKVYEYIFPNGMIYVGITKNTIQNRRDCGYQHNERLTKAHRLYGWKNVTTIILEDKLSKEAACEREIEYIKKLKADNPNVGFNVSKGGMSTYAGLKHTEEFKRYLSEKYKGRVFSESSLEKMRAAHKKERKPVIRCSLDGTEIVDFESLGEAASSVGGDRSNITRACISGKPYRGYLWKAKGGDER